MASTHVSNFGYYGQSIPHDLQGFTHTTIREWAGASIDGGAGHMSRAELRAWARERAAESRQAIRAAEAQLSHWRRG